MPFIELQSVDSTNNYARSLLHKSYLPDLPGRQAGRQDLTQHGTVIFAHEQLAGKGQRGKVWTTEKDANIILSVLIKPDPLHLVQQFHLSACVAIALQDFFLKYAGDDSKIKWPNDLYWQDRKAGGVLIESGVGSSESGVNNEQRTTDNGQRARLWKWAIVGIGININQTEFPPELPNPVSLKQITGKNFDPLVLAKELCVILNNYFQQLMTEGFDVIYSQYLDHLYKKNEIVKLKKGNRVFEATIKSISPTGQLIVQHVMEEAFGFGEIEWLV
jgi:BirA family biotin operon repressor/biotin-[acetyl-CoA-carboxylase] ligase